jgi:hypothetical protein
MGRSNLGLRDPSLAPPTVDRSARNRIGAQLRAMYSDLERQPLPQRLLDLMRQLDERKE